jgi:organic hydroperoxide reductase OsmC/OhrA
VHQVGAEEEAMVTPFPHHYETALSWSGIGGAMVTAGPRPPIVGGAPPEFEGMERWWSPEHLLLSSLNLCLQTTFEALARKRRISIGSYRGRAEATLDRKGGAFGFTLLSLDVSITCAEEDIESVRETAMRAKQYCLVANALNVPVHLKLDVSPWVPQAAIAV